MTRSQALAETERSYGPNAFVVAWPKLKIYRTGFRAPDAFKVVGQGRTWAAAVSEMRRVQTWAAAVSEMRRVQRGIIILKAAI